MNYRADQYATTDDTDAGPAEFPSLAGSAFHDAAAASNVADPRRTPPSPDTTTLPALPRSIRNLRGVPDPAHPQNNETGVGELPASGYAWGTTGGGAPSGAPHGITTDPDAHGAFNAPPRQVSAQIGIGLRDNGDWSSSLGGFTDPRAHEQSSGNGNVSERHETGGYRFTTPQFDVSPEERVQREGVPVPMTAGNAMELEKPVSWFTQGRPARRNLAYYVRPFDQVISQRMTGDKVNPTSPPSVGGQLIDATPRASLPLRTTHEDRVPGTAYNGPTFAAPGMQPAEPSPNTWRLQPQPWDEYLINTSGIDV